MPTSSHKCWQDRNGNEIYYEIDLQTLPLPTLLRSTTEMLLKYVFWADRRWISRRSLRSMIKWTYDWTFVSLMSVNDHKKSFLPCSPVAIRRKPSWTTDQREMTSASCFCRQDSTATSVNYDIGNIDQPSRIVLIDRNGNKLRYRSIFESPPRAVYEIVFADWRVS